MAFMRQSGLLGVDDVEDPIPLPTTPPGGDAGGAGGADIPGFDDVETPVPFEPIDPNPPGTTPPAPAPSPAPLPDPDADASAVPPDLIGDIPPPPVPEAPPITGVGVAGIHGTEGRSFSRPGTPSGARFRTSAFYSQRPQRFGPGVPVLGGANPVPGLDAAAGLSPEEAAELLAGLAARRQ
jgi:hypothetical protein